MKELTGFSIWHALAIRMSIVIWMIVALFSVGVFTLSLAARYSLFHSSYQIFLDFIHAVASFGIAAIIYWKKQFNPFAWFASIALMATGTVTTLNTVQVVYPSLDWLCTGIIFLSSGYLVFFYLFPNGRFVPRWSMYAAALWMIFSVGRTFLKGSFLDPFTWPPLYNYSGWIAFHLLALAAQVVRYRKYATSVERQQTKWFVYGLAFMVMGLILQSILENTKSLLEPEAADKAVKLAMGTISSLAAIMVPISIGVAMQRYRLWDIDYLINRTLLYIALSAGVIGIYMLVVGSFGVLLQTRSGNFLVSMLAAGLIAILVHPLRHGLQRIIDRMMYGERDLPFLVLSRLGQRLEVSLASQDVLPVVVETLALALKLPYVAVAIRDQDDSERIAASYGTHVEPVMYVPLVYRSGKVGVLQLSPRSPNEEFSTYEQNMLAELARQVGVAVHNVRITADLQLARERLVTAREEERRRLRRDLHDSMGPELASLSMLTDAAQNMLPDRPEDVKHLLKEISGQLQSTIGDIRQIVYALRPPVLDELGLAYAIREQIEQLSSCKSGLRFAVEGPDTLPPLPAAVEVAAYRIVQEAVTNVVRHSQAASCRIVYRIKEELYLEVSDDGRGFSSSQRRGVGLTSMKERAEELSGQFAIDERLGGGTIVTARLPIPREGE